MKIKFKRSTCDKITPSLKWLLVLSMIFKVVWDIWTELPVKIYEDIEDDGKNI